MSLNIPEIPVMDQRQNMINFCDGKLKPRVSCDRLSKDGHSVENLISTEFTKQRAGFISEYFIKPPVTISFSFPCNIEISEIIINPIVGAQKSVGFEIYSSSSKVKESWIHDQNYDRMSLLDSGILYQPIGKTLLQKPGILCFKNNRFCPASSSGKETVYSDGTPEYYRELRHHKSQALNFISSVNIRITRAEAGKSVAVRSIQIWGQPSRSVPQDIQVKIRELYFLKLPAYNEVPKLHDSSSSKHDSTLKTTDIAPESGVDIPEEFIDAITCEIMTIPMLLPCGKNIDQSTLERHNSFEATWGRMPSDPFTGKELGSNNNPIPNIPLKVRIDKFILLHRDKFKDLPRTLGRHSYESKDSIEYPSTSRLLYHPTDRGSDTNSMSEESEISASKYVSFQQNMQCNQTKEKKIPKTRSNGNLIDQQFTGGINKLKDNNSHKVIDLTNDEDENVSSKNLKRSDLQPCFTHPSKRMRHEDSLKSSLDSAVTSALSELPSFTKLSTKSKGECGTITGNHGLQEKEEKCQCRVCGNKDLLFYKAPCGHFYCKNCLSFHFDVTKNNTIKDDLCGRVWHRKDIFRVHSVH